ncbi:MAG: glycosyltransferase, partial [Actinobacteria bacterium]|nr:glycosyltransferase [Actinomycetota bacterium]
MDVELSYCVVNTEGRDVLMRCLDAVDRERAAAPFPTELLVLDNGSDDGSPDAVRRRPDAGRLELIALPLRRGKAENDSALMRRARGRYCLLLNEDSELLPGATAALHAALAADPRAAAAGAVLLRPDGRPQPCAWRFPSVATALAGAALLHRRYTVQSTGDRIRRVDWAQSSALLVRREAAAEVGYMDPEFFVYSDEVDFQKRLHERGWHTLYVPAARAVHHEQLSTGGVPDRRIVEFARNRDRYIRKHHGPAAAAAVRWLTSFTYAARSLAALALPGHDPRRYWRHASATLHPDR